MHVIRVKREREREIKIIILRIIKHYIVPLHNDIDLVLVNNLILHDLFAQ